MPAGLSQQKNAVINIWSSALQSRTTCGASTGRGKMLFVNLSFNSDLNGTDLSDCRNNGHSSHPQLCVMSLNNTVFNSHNCNNIVHCLETLFRYKRRSTVWAVMGKIPPFCTIKGTEPSGWALCSMFSRWQTPRHSQSCKWLRYKHQSNIYLVEMELMCMFSRGLQGELTRAQSKWASSPRP